MLKLVMQKFTDTDSLTKYDQNLTLEGIANEF